mgnify:CR=1 FL=1
MRLGNRGGGGSARECDRGVACAKRRILRSLKHAGDVKTTYANLRAVWVEVGQQVAAGKPLGDMGAASSASGGVLRFTVECDGESQDPAVCLGQRF